MKRNQALLCVSLLILGGCSTTPAGLDEAGTLPRTAESDPSWIATTAAASAPVVSTTRTPSETVSVGSGISGAAVAAGRSHTCVILNDGSVKCWGKNEYGQLGNGTTIGSSVPVGVVGVSDAAAVVAGWGHSCALTKGGRVICWGYNRNGELGNGKTQHSSLPVDVIGIPGAAVAIEAGDDHTCAVTSAGRVMCWGYNEFGQLGDGTTASRSVPVEAQALSDRIRSVAAGWGHTCALTDKGGVRCWGNNQLGQLGYGQTADYRFTAVDVLGLGSGVAEIASDGGSACALTAGGGVKCWGSNTYGQLGDGTAVDRRSPVPVSGLGQGVVRVAVGWNHACAVTGTGELKCWGWNYYGQLGDATTTSRIVPVRATGLTDGVTDIGMGWAHSCIVTEQGGVNCWGLNENGQLGDGTRIDSAAPLAVFGIRSAWIPVKTATPTDTTTSTPAMAPAQTHTRPSTATPTMEAAGPLLGAVTAIESRYDTTCALTGGGVVCWGRNDSGQIADGTKEHRSKPVYAGGLSSGMAAVTVGNTHTCALTVAGGIKCWGENGYGGLGDGTTAEHLMPVDVSGLTGGVAALAAGTGFTCALLESGGVKCWGWNREGQLGDGTTVNRLHPVDVVGLSSGVTALVTGVSHACALLESGGVKCWGWNGKGQLGDGTTVDRLTPVDVRGLSGGVTALAAGSHFTCALTAAGGVKCWGYNWIGQLGDGTTADRLRPVDVIGLESGVVALAAGSDHACALTAAGGVKCWGNNGFGELGDGTTRRLAGPVDATVLTGGVAALAAGLSHTCALTRAGRVKCWGDNTLGQLGDGTTTGSILPVDVVGVEMTANTPAPTAGNGGLSTNTPTVTPT
jgi:alpha-tubulin suppressor-like RCC1 family protein